MSNEIERTQDPKKCSICSSLADHEFAYQKFGWEENDTSLPQVASQLIVLRELHPFDSRTLELQQCPECGTHYLKKTDYEYLVNGTEDQQCLKRLSQAEAAQYICQPSVESD